MQYIGEVFCTNSEKGRARVK